MSDPNSRQHEIHHQAEVDSGLAGARLDQALAQLFPDYSRSRLKAWVDDGRVTVNGEQRRPRDKVGVGDRINLAALLEEQVECAPQQIDLNIVFEDQHLLVVNKPAGLVVHPAAGNPDGTLQNALLYHAPDLIELPRAGIVHRLDKDTTGLMVVAKSAAAHTRLVAAMAAREIKREYRALVVGSLRIGATIDLPIGRHPSQRTRMAVNPMGKPSVTHFEILEQFRGHTLLRVRLETGRTHQIRVHMAHIRHPVFGDPVYGGRLRLPPGVDDDLRDLLRGFRRQALHAKRLQLQHPVTGRTMRWDAPIPADMVELLSALRGEPFDEDWYDDDTFDEGFLDEY